MFAKCCFNQPETALGGPFTLQSSREAFALRGCSAEGGLLRAGLLEKNPSQRSAQTLWPSMFFQFDEKSKQ